jgi:hypothetical protein
VQVCSRFAAAVQAAIDAYAVSRHMLDAALAYAAHGIPVFPLSARSKAPIPKRDKDARGMEIPRSGGFYKATCDPVTIHKWWDRTENLIGVPMGPRSGVWAVDVDTNQDHADDGIAAWQALLAEHGDITSRTHITASDGLHVVLIYPDDEYIGCKRGSIPKGIEIKGAGGYIVMPPSKRKGRFYTIGNNIDPIHAPDWLLDLIKTRPTPLPKATRDRNTNLIARLTVPEDRSDNAPFACDDIPRELLQLASAVAAIPNDEEAWDDWTELGLAIYAACGKRGFPIFNAWSKRARKYDPVTTRQRWLEIDSSPPNRFGSTGRTIYQRAERYGWLPTTSPTYPQVTFVELEAARAQFRQIVRKFLTTDEASNGYLAHASSLGLEPPPPRVWAARIDTGVGKTKIAIEEIAQSGKTGIIYAVPTHKLGREIEQRFKEHGVSARVFRGRAADDPERIGEAMCLNLRAVELALKLRADISETCCHSKGRWCQYYDRCGYQRQKAGRSPYIWIVASDLLFHHQRAFGKPSLLIVDEALWQKSLRGIEQIVQVPLARLGNASKVRGALVYRLLMQTEDGGLQRRHIEQMTTNELTEMIRSEWASLPKVRLRPGMTSTQVARLKQDESTIQEISDGRIFIDILEELRWMLLNPAIEISGRVLLDCSGLGVIRWRGVANIGKQFRIPTLLLDATLPEPAVLRVLHPQVEIVADIRVALPTCVMIKQILRAPTSARKLIANSRLKDREQHLRAVRRYILLRWFEIGKARSVVICQQEVEDWLAGKLPDNIELAHFNAISGIDEFKDVRLLILVGRTQPGPDAVAALAGALSGAEPGKVATDPRTGFSWYDRVRRGIRMRDGTGIAVDGDEYPDTFVEAVRWQITERELVQALGRGRGVNRTDETPLDIDLLLDTCLPVTVDQVSTWQIPSLLIDAAIDGVMLTSPVDMVRIWPDLWPNAKAAKRTIAMGIPDLPGFQRFAYQLNGPKLKSRVAYFDPGIIPDPRRWLELRLGPLTNLSP